MSGSPPSQNSDEEYEDEEVYFNVRETEMSESERLDRLELEESPKKLNSEEFLAQLLKAKITGLDLKSEFLTTGCPHLDEELEGGISGFGLTEIVGEAGYGKTQICLQLALTAQLPLNKGGLESGVIYINTESAFPSKRLSELADHMKAKFEDLPEDLMSGIILEHVADAECLVKCLKERIPKIMKERKIGLIILDSIAAVFRSEFELTATAERTGILYQVATLLHNIAGRNRCTLVVVNQVTGCLKTNESIPSLARSWRTFVTTRIQLSRIGDSRSITIPFSPYIPLKSIPFEIQAEGVRFAGLKEEL